MDTRARFRLIVPFNGTDGSGLARCYAHIGLRDGQKNSSLPAARWQEAGGYNSTCGPTSLDAFPVTDQVRTLKRSSSEPLFKAMVLLLSSEAYLHAQLVLLVWMVSKVTLEVPNWNGCIERHDAFFVCATLHSHKPIVTQCERVLP